MAESKLRNLLGQLYNRSMAIGGTSAFVWGVLCALLLATAIVWVDLVWELSSFTRASVTWLAIGGLFTVGGLLTWRAHRNSSNIALVSRLDRAGNARGQIVAGWELSNASAKGSTLSQGMAMIAVQRAATLADSVSHTLVAPWRAARGSFISVSGAALTILGLSLMMPRMAHTQWLRFSDPYGDHPPYTNIVLALEPGDAHVVYGQGLDIEATVDGPQVEQVDLVMSNGDESIPMFLTSGGKWRASIERFTESTTYFVTAGRARSARHRIEVQTVPRIETVQFVVHPLPYTGKKRYEGPMPADGIVGLAGTRIEITASSNRPLAYGTVRITDGQQSKTIMLAEKLSENQVHGSFEISNSGKMELRVTDQDEQQSVDSVNGSITMLEDQRPLIRLTQPKKDSFATARYLVACYGCCRRRFLVSLACRFFDV